MTLQALAEEKWIDGCQEVLKQLEDFTSRKGRDRLDMLKSIRYSIQALQRSLMGWWQWSTSPEMMANFTLEELQEMEKAMIDFTRSFIEYDMKMTGCGAKFQRVEKNRRDRIVV